ncbi:hypothetical protein [Methylobacterium ajmalii]|nr:hypothetical protein [Methylobacterium ajmalii]
MVCKTLKPIAWSDKDTAETIRQVKANNAAYKSLACGQGTKENQ